MIFEDPTRRRWKTTVTLFLAFCTVSLVSVATFFAGMTFIPPVHEARDADDATFHGVAIRTTPSDISFTPSSKPRWFRDTKIVLATNTSEGVDLKRFIRGDGRSYLSTAFLAQNEVDSVNSFLTHQNNVDAVFPDWYYFTQGDCNIGQRENVETTKLLKESGVAILPRVTNVADGVTYIAQTRTVLRYPKFRSCSAKTLATLAKDAGVDGLNMDVRGLAPTDRISYTAYLKELAELLHAQNQALTINVPSSDLAFDLQTVSAFVDGVVIMAYDEHSATTAPGAVASTPWHEETMRALVEVVPAEKIIVAMGTHGYDWTLGSKEPVKKLDFNEVMTLAANVNAQPTFHETQGNMNFSYLDGTRTEHEVWFLNGVTAWNTWHEAKKYNYLGIAVMEMGTEDPSLWKFLGSSTATADDLKIPPALQNISYEDAGEFFRVEQLPHEGKVDLTVNVAGFITQAKYITIPEGYVIDRYGQEIPKKHLLLTFNDGPDPEWTPKILDILKKHGIQAIFFVRGDQAQKYPEILARIGQEGHLIGLLSDKALGFELTGAERMLQSATAKSTLLFRAPDSITSTPKTLDEARIYAGASRLGYVITGAGVDAMDWKYQDSASIESQVENALAENAKDRHVIVFHDGGNNRAGTVEALNNLIPALQNKGYIFTTVETAIGVPTNTLNPPMPGNEKIFVRTASLFALIEQNAEQMIVGLFFLTTAISAVRIFFMGLVFFRSRLRRKKIYGNGKYRQPAVSVVIPAFNEEETIEKTIRSVATSTYKNYKIIVVNDGSTDNTALVVSRLQYEYPRLRLINKSNEGKSAALNLVFKGARTPIIVTIDADTILYPDTLEKIVRPFEDPSVDAVCGNVEVGNIRNLLTGFQALEYITTQNFDRLAFDELNCISVVPGATGAWRRKKVLELGGYSDDTLTEDADITIKLLRAGGKIVYEREARSKTEAPDSSWMLAKQRVRWSFGTYQCLYKHKGALFKGSVGWVALPNMLIFQVLFPLVSPIGDIAFILSVATGHFQSLLAGYILFLLMDALSALLAFSIERRSFKLIWLILIHRFYYRQFMYFVAFHSLLQTLRGTRQGWRKIKRTGSVQANLVTVPVSA